MQRHSYIIRTVAIFLCLGQMLGLCSANGFPARQASGAQVSASECNWIGGALSPKEFDRERLAKFDEWPQLAVAANDIWQSELDRFPLGALLPKPDIADTLVAQAVLLLN